MSTKFVYFFGEGKADGQSSMKPLLGGKGAGLAEMTNLGLPVPPGFTITTQACRHFSCVIGDDAVPFSFCTSWPSQSRPAAKDLEHISCALLPGGGSRRSSRSTARLYCACTSRPIVAPLARPCFCP